MPTRTRPLLVCDRLSVSVPGRRLVDTLDIEFEGGEFVAILGPNGVGKSLTLLTLAGLREPEQGTVSLLQQNIFASKRSDVARHLALLTQSVEDIFPATVIDTALIGRHPHVGAMQWESARDYEIANNALRLMDLEALAARDVLTLSGGERRRLAIAQVLAQTPDIYLLDEPSNHLDPQHQLDVLQTFRGTANDGRAVIASLHDVNLAVRFADRCLLLFGDGRWDLGPTGDILSESRLETLYGTSMEAVHWRGQRLFVAAGSDQSETEAFNLSR